MVPPKDGTGNGEGQGPQPLTPSQQEAARLKALFEDVSLLEITGVDLRGKTPQEIVRLLPEMRGDNPVRAILIDVGTGRAYGVRSGWLADPVEEHNGLLFRNGNIGPEVARPAGRVWESLGHHVEAQAAAFMRKVGIAEAVLCINAANPCYQKGDGCFFRLHEMLAEGAKLTVYNKYGETFSRKHRWPFSFAGTPDELR